MSFKYSTHIRLYHTDAAQILFYGNVYLLTQEAFESLLVNLGSNIGQLLEDGDLGYPIVHSEADYLAPLKAGEKIDIVVSVKKIGNSSFTLSFEIYGHQGQKKAEAATTQVCIDRSSHSTRSIPGSLRSQLEDYLKA